MLNVSEQFEYPPELREVLCKMRSILPEELDFIFLIINQHNDIPITLTGMTDLNKIVAVAKCFAKGIESSMVLHNYPPESTSSGGN